MYRFTFFKIVFTAAVFLFPLNAGADFTTENYMLTLSSLKDTPTKKTSAYTIRFEKSQKGQACLTTFRQKDNLAEIDYYTCTLSPVNGGFGLSRLDNGNSLPEVSAVFSGITHDNPDKKGIALANSGNIEKIYADFIGNASGKAFGAGILYNTGSIGEINGDFIGSRLINNSLDLPVKSGTLVNLPGGKISRINANFIDNSLDNRGGTQNSALYNAGSISRLNGIFAGNRVRGDFGNSAVLLNDGELVAVKGTFSANSVKAQKADAGGAVYNKGSINLLEADFIDNRLQTVSANTGGAAVRLAQTGKIYTIRNASFITNSAFSESGHVYGGALYISGPVDGIISNPVFINNTARGQTEDSAFGGAIYTEKPLTFNVEGSRRGLFSGNRTDNNGRTDSNAFFINKTSVIFAVGESGSYLFDDNIRGKDYLLSFNGGGTGVFLLRNTVFDALRVSLKQGIMKLEEGPFGKGGFSGVSELRLIDSLLGLNNSCQDTLTVDQLQCSNCKIGIDVNTGEMSADNLQIKNLLEGTVALDVYTDTDDDIRGQQPLTFAVSGSFAAHRNSFAVKKVHGSPFMFDILYKEENDGLKKSWSLVMNDIPNPDYRPQTTTSAKEEAPSAPNDAANASPARENKVTPSNPDCQGNVGCLFFKGIARVTLVFYLIIDAAHKITDMTLTAIKKSLFWLMEQLAKIINFFAPEPLPEETSSAVPTAAEAA